MGILVALFFGACSLYTAWLTLLSLITLNFWGFIMYGFVTLIFWVIAAIAVEL